MKNQKFDLYQEITNRIIEKLEQGVIPWHKPWLRVTGNASEFAVSHKNGKPYSLLNQMLIGEPGEYITFKQCKDKGGRIKKGAKSRQVIYWDFIKKIDEETEEEETIPFLKYYNIFNINDCEGITPKHEPHIDTSSSATTLKEPDTVIDNYIKARGVTLEKHLSNKAYYRPSTDTVALPSIEQFNDTSEYYSTAFHELVHSTGHKKRLDRLTKQANFGNEEYSKEELVAEIGAAACLNMLDIETERSFENNAAYIQSWLKVLRNDKKMIVSASGKAEKAVEMIFKSNDNQPDEEEPTVLIEDGASAEPVTTNSEDTNTSPAEITITPEEGPTELEKEKELFDVQKLIDALDVKGDSSYGGIRIEKMENAHCFNLNQTIFYSKGDKEHLEKLLNLEEAQLSEMQSHLDTRIEALKENLNKVYQELKHLMQIDVTIDTAKEYKKRDKAIIEHTNNGYNYGAHEIVDTAHT